MKDIVEILGEFINSKESEIEKWFLDMSKKDLPCFYNSVDLRYSGFKLAPIDTNIFPAGFNNLRESEIDFAAEKAAFFLNENFHSAKKIMILPEAHDRNLPYIDNLLMLQKILSKVCEKLIFASPNADLSEDFQQMQGSKGESIILHKIINKNSQIQTINGDVPDLIISNNDFTAGLMDVFHNINQQIIPSSELGWHKRTKTNHFDTYSHVVRSFLNDFKELEIDPLRISTIYHNCGSVNFKERKGLDCVATGVQKVLHLIQEQNEKFNIQEKPYVFIKSDKGTYGMGIMTASSAEEVYEINKKTRNKMNIIKQNVQNNKIIIQEGISTLNLIDGKVAEPMIYLIGGRPVSAFYRINEKKNASSNLNSSGMYFDNVNLCDRIKEKDVFFRSCSLVAKLAALAASRE